MPKLTSVHADRIKPAQSNANLSIVRTELPNDVRENAKFATGFVAVPNFAVHLPENGKFATIDVSENMKVQYTDKDGKKQMAQVAGAELVDAHKEAHKAYMKQRTAEVAKDAPEAAVEAETEVEAGA